MTNGRRWTATTTKVMSGSESAVIVVAYEKKQTTVADAQGHGERCARGMCPVALFDDARTCRVICGRQRLKERENKKKYYC